MSLIIIIFVILFLFTALLACLEMAISSVNRLRIKTKIDTNKNATKIIKVLDDYDRTLTTIIVLNNIINIILPTLSTVIFIDIFINHKELGIILSTVFLTILLLMFGEILPKTYGKKNPEKVLFTFIRFIEVIIVLFRPVTFLFIQVNTFVKNKFFATTEETSEVEEELLTMIEESEGDGKIEKREGELLKNAIEFNDIRVDEILQPKNKMIMVEKSLPKEEIYKIIVAEKYSRIPVYDKTTDNIVGILSEREFLRKYVKEKEFLLEDILRKVIFIPDTLKISKLLPQMQKKYDHMAIVVDEYGTVQGLITVEDILEELVGEIWDEHDEVIQDVVKIKDNQYQIIGNLTISDFNKLFEFKNIDTETEDSTIAGYILEKIEKVPVVNDIYEDINYKFKIIEMDGNKIEIIEVTLKNV